MIQLASGKSRTPRIFFYFFIFFQTEDLLAPFVENQDREKKFSKGGKKKKKDQANKFDSHR